MKPLNFTKLLCGPSNDLFTKDFAHNNHWEFEYLSKGPVADLNNNLRLEKSGEFVGSSTFKHNFNKFSSELKFNTGATHHLEVLGNVPFVPGLLFGSRFVYNFAKGTHNLVLFSEHVSNNVSSRVELKPLDNVYNGFALFHDGTDKKCLLGLEVNSNKTTKFNYTLGAGYKHLLGDKNVQLSFRVFGGDNKYFDKLVGNLYLTKDEFVQPLVVGALFEQGFSEKVSKLSLAGSYHLTPLTNQHATFLRVKCDDLANVALTLGQKFNKHLTLLFGCEFNAKKFDSKDLKYGVKFSFTD